MLNRTEDCGSGLSAGCKGTAMTAQKVCDRAAVDGTFLQHTVHFVVEQFRQWGGGAFQLETAVRAQRTGFGVSHLDVGGAGTFVSVDHGMAAHKADLDPVVPFGMYDRSHAAQAGFPELPSVYGGKC